MLSAHAYPALLLNADYRPIMVHPLKLLPWRRAVKGTMRGRYVTVDEYDRSVHSFGGDHSEAMDIRLPSVVALKRLEKMDRPAAFTRLGVLIRDRYRCAYCGHRFPASQLTFDHVIPRSRGGRTNWENIVACCAEHNIRKGCRSVKEAGLKLLAPPYVPNRRHLNEIGLEFPPPVSALHKSWLPWLGLESVMPDGETDAGSAAVFPSGMTSLEYWTVELEE